MSSSSRARTAAMAALSILAVAIAIRAAQVAVIIKLKGSVECLVSDGSPWAPARAGQSLALGAQIKTGADGLAMVKFLADGSMMRLRPGTHLTIGDKEGKGGGAGMDLGAALFEVGKDQARRGFVVRTPAAVATVKGTRFWVTVDSTGATTVVCTEGTVRLRASGSRDEKDVGAGRTGATDGRAVTVRASSTEDIPEEERSRELKVEFKDRNNATRKLRIEFGQTQ